MMTTLFDPDQPPRPRVICLGLAAYDYTWTVADLPAGDGKVRALDRREGGGGMAANASVAIARLGGSVTFWGRAGDDPAGRAMSAELASFGVEIGDFRLFEGARSSVSGVTVDAHGERMIVNFRGADLPVDAAWLPLTEVSDAAAVLADPRWPEGALALFEAARRQGVPTILDADVAEAAVFDLLLPHTDYAVFSAPGLSGYVRSASLELDAQLRFARSSGCRLAAVTRGARGLSWDDGDGVHHLPAFPVRVVDTTGAGDAFHGALAFAIGAGADVACAFRFSAAVAALKCTQAGGRSGCPDLRDTVNYIHQF
ncbi:Sulfofructose kinase [Paraburkholderia aspalathi]|uniref:sugar kinase n=1 Tax=Paraburkholderia aspalathi TaxID=1324617 RepID=UPI001B23924B|nr:sugar kinase [Paraburkholderia aspalathi]MBK3842288.1 sugar kinase [Paraburkholderia aspalathi]CAE6827570.1 Sulfofructose kinase [Paraburkholderia aspalathi]CAE6832909.1 Sulfofructose kinase [Paraburkholderia aspalathi]